MRPPAGLRVSREKRRYDVCFVSCDVWFNSMFPWITLQFSWTSYFLTSGLVGILSKVRSVSSPPPFIPQSIGDYMGTFIIVVSLGYLLCRMAKSSMCNAVVNDSYARCHRTFCAWCEDLCNYIYGIIMSACFCISPIWKYRTCMQYPSSKLQVKSSSFV